MSIKRKLEGPIIKSAGTTKCIVIFLHGWGSDGNDLIQIANVWKNELQQTTFIAPNGPEVCTENPLGRQWFNIMTEEDVMLTELNRAYLDLKEFIGITIDSENKFGIINHTRPLTPFDVIHELLHVKYPSWTEEQINNQTNIYLNNE